MASHPFSPWHYLTVGLLFAIVVPWFIWHATGRTQTPGLQQFNTDPSCSAANLLAGDAARQGACTVTLVPVDDKRSVTEYRPTTMPHQKYLISVSTGLADNPTFQIVGPNVLPDVTMGKPLYVLIYRRQIVMSLINGQAVVTVNNPNNTASTNTFRKVLTVLSLLVAAGAFFIAVKMLFFPRPDHSQAT